ncbi:unnamed protein product [Vitrella brassicaformis CCMP3155]|uniref:Uncharacterized protein n=1 Tax=Vitrella brassicaformis (strain CCMP3155) TaxID=1169540 RepID=A0A0G4GKF6_VITBC|nr:unnamed protein product [Vitrella brassicaformis CCMP3155]|eukprot:CEM30511.1 unnamed protein product [Vitrella brassicaformis CCMP3155]
MDPYAPPPGTEMTAWDSLSLPPPSSKRAMAPHKVLDKQRELAEGDKRWRYTPEEPFRPSDIEFLKHLGAEVVTYGMGGAVFGGTFTYWAMKATRSRHVRLATIVSSVSCFVAGYLAVVTAYKEPLLAFFERHAETVVDYNRASGKLGSQTAPAAGAAAGGVVRKGDHYVESAGGSEEGNGEAEGVQRQATQAPAQFQPSQMALYERVSKIFSGSPPPAPPPGLAIPQTLPSALIQTGWGSLQRDSRERGQITSSSSSSSGRRGFGERD